MNTEEAIKRIQEIAAAQPRDVATDATAAQSIKETLEGAMSWIKSTGDELSPSEISLSGIRGAIDFQYGDVERFAVIAVHNTEFWQCTAVFGNMPYDDSLLGVFHPTVEQIKAFLAR